MKTDSVRDARRRKLKQRLFRMVSVGVVGEPFNQAYDIISTLALIANLAAAVMNTFAGIRESYGGILAAIEAVTVAFFAVDYVLRLYTAECLYPEKQRKNAVFRYMVSFAGIVDLLSFLPYYLPVFFPAGAAAFRLIRMARILRLFRINAYYDSLNVITEVIIRKRQMLLSSVFIILVLMLGASLCMYSLEHEAQPEVFKNAFSGIWWCVSTLLTVGYGDIYPVTVLGRLFGIVITFLGVGVVAIPTGIISAGFVEQYTLAERMGAEIPEEDEEPFISVVLQQNDGWCGKRIRELGIPKELYIDRIARGDRMLVPSGSLVLLPDDRLLLFRAVTTPDKELEKTESASV